MKILKYALALFLVSSLFACKPESKPKTKAPITKTTQTKSKKAKNVKKKAGNNYWAQLKKALKLSDAQVNGLKVIHAKYTKLKTAVPKVNGKKDAKRIKALNQQQQAETKKLLGDVLYKKKVAFDKKRKQKQKKKK